MPHFRNPVVTVGSFDGVHSGHRKLLKIIADVAADRGGESVVVTFDPHPREVLGGSGRHGKQDSRPDSGVPRLLTTLEEKIALLDAVGIDNLIVAPFTREFSRLPYADFVRDYLVGRIGVATLVVGYNHHFGHGAEGNFHALGELGGELGFNIYMVSRHDVGDDKVSSTVIRRLISEGRMAEAERLLGYPYFLFGRIDTDGSVTAGKAKLLPPAGAYPVMTEVGETLLRIVDDGQMFLEGIAANDRAVVTFE